MSDTEIGSVESFVLQQLGNEGKAAADLTEAAKKTLARFSQSDISWAVLTLLSQRLVEITADMRVKKRVGEPALQP